MNPLNPPDGIQPLRLTPYINRGLFADHYLKERLKEYPEFKRTEGLDAAFNAILDLYRTRAIYFTPDTNEPQTENDFIRPVLDILWGVDCYQVQVVIPTIDMRRQPDYALFTSPQDRTAAQQLVGTMDYWRTSPCLADAKRWSDSLDTRRAYDDNPSLQITNYLYRSGVKWGILTNGRNWRLYEHEKSSKGGVYFEIDLANILDAQDRAHFKQFYLFFRRHALIPDEQGVTFLDRVAEGSAQYAAEVGNKLKESVYDALRQLMNGLLTHPSNKLDANDPGTLKEVHDNALIVLYRLLFILYAEDRGLLDCDDPTYLAYSLREKYSQINTHLRERRKHYVPRMGQIWQGLMDVFSLIDQGYSDGGVPAYNGGLFSPERNPRLAYEPLPGIRPWTIGDQHLAQTIDLLAYERKPGATVGNHMKRVDYKSLAVQHLGSIYEGLLELQPYVATEPLVEAADNGKAVFKPASQVPIPKPIKGRPPLKVDTGEVYLVTNRGERKATGSYYTPKYVVDYIVENTLGPLTDEAAKQVAALRPEVDAEIARLGRERSQWEGQAGGGGQAARNEVEKRGRAIEEQKRRLLEPYLTLKVLDPAMGSGHFLVGAADFLSLAIATDPNLLLPDSTNGDDPLYAYKRMVVQRCLYGVDLNPLAVELAKLSLWLHTVSRERALSFLDHHLRCGNSLIGARIEEDLTKPPPRLNAHGKRIDKDNGQLVFGFSEALTSKHLNSLLDSFREIMESPNSSAETEHHKDDIYRAMDRERDRYRAVANVWLAPYFGVEITAEQYGRAVNSLNSTEAERQALTQEDWFQKAQQAANERRYFHWELEFPEVFFTPTGLKPQAERGFDIVMGNPPYVQIAMDSIISADLRPYLLSRYQSSMGRLNTFGFFVRFAMETSCADGFTSMIVPNTLLTMPYYAELRGYILLRSRIRRLLMLETMPFDSAIVENVVFVAQIDWDVGSRSTSQVQIDQPKLVDGKLAFSPSNKAVLQSNFDNAKDHTFGVSLVAEHLDLRRKIEHATRPLGSLANINQAIALKHDRSAYISNQRLDSSYKPLLDGRDIGRYQLVFANAWLKYDSDAIHSCKREDIFLAKEKLLFRRVGDSLVACYDEEQYYALNTLVVITPKLNAPSLRFLLALINSNLLNWFFLTFLKSSKQVFSEIQARQLAQLPIVSWDETTERSIKLEHVATVTQSIDRLLASHGPPISITHTLDLLPEPPERSGALHDLLAYLAGEMIRMNREKQQETSGFLTWLEREIGAKIDSLTNKTKLKDYHEHDLDELLAVLRQNRNSLRVDPDARAIQEAIRRELEASLAKLQPLKQRIALTDTLIDEIVYRLYGLSEVEIAIVKAATA